MPSEGGSPRSEVSKRRCNARKADLIQNSKFLIDIFKIFATAVLIGCIKNVFVFRNQRPIQLLVFWNCVRKDFIFRGKFLKFVQWCKSFSHSWKLILDLYLIISTRPLLQKGSSLKRKFCLSVRLSVCLPVITFSFFEFSIIWWSRPCKPYIFWKLIMLATSTALFWPITTEY